MIDKTIQTIPSETGSYLLWLHLPQPKILKVGSLGSFPFPVGDYVYLGSANGPGGLRARLGRHLQGACHSGPRKPHWHIDYLRAAAQVRGFGYQTSAPHLPPQECVWSQKLAALPKSRIVAPRFGASDCHSGCAAHLIHFPTLDVDQIANLLNCEIRILNSASLHPAV